MEKLQKIVELCAAGVHLSANRHRDYYESVERYLSNDHRGKNEDVISEIDPEKTLWELQFYPTTPIGFYIGISNDLDELLTWALDILEGRGDARRS